MELIKAFPHLAKIDLFNMAVFYRKTQDVEYLLTNCEISGINSDFILDRVESSENALHRQQNMHILWFVIFHIPSLIDSTPRFTYSNLARKFPSSLIPVLISVLKRESKIDKKIISHLIQITIDSNSKEAMKSLLEFKEYLNEYQYTIFLCGTGTSADLVDRMEIVKEISDECIETAYLCHNFPVLKDLRDVFKTRNIFLEEKIIQDREFYEWLFLGKRGLLKYYNC